MNAKSANDLGRPQSGNKIETAIKTNGNNNNNDNNNNNNNR